MILRFLRLFAEFRHLEHRREGLLAECAELYTLRDKQISEFQAEHSAKIQAQERCRDLEADNLQLRSDLKTAQDATIHSTQLVADWLAQLQFGQKIYSQAPSLPEKPQEPELVQRQGAQARRLVDETTANFYREYYDREPQG